VSCALPLAASHTVRRKSCGTDPRAVAFEDTQFLSARGIPHPGGLIVTSSEDSMAVQRKADPAKASRTPRNS
jgi:hypothetical protein